MLNFRTDIGILTCASIVLLCTKDRRTSECNDGIHTSELPVGDRNDAVEGQEEHLTVHLGMDGIKEEDYGLRACSMGYRKRG